MIITKVKDLEFIPASHESPTDPGVLKKVLFKKDILPKGQMQMVNWSKIPVGKSFQLHYHEDMIEVFIIVSGVAEMTVENETAELSAGDAVLVPIKQKHTMKNSGTQDMYYIVFGVSVGDSGKTVVV